MDVAVRPVRPALHRADHGVAGLDVVQPGVLTGATIQGSWHSSTIDLSNVTLTNIDAIDGGDGHDTIIGSAGNDTLLGGRGNDQLEGGLGNDEAFGGEGSDTYAFNPFEGMDTFHGGEGWTDVVQLNALADENADPDNPWTIVVDGVQQEYDLAMGALELDPDSAGTITLSDGSELNFDGVEKIEW